MIVLSAPCMIVVCTIMLVRHLVPPDKKEIGYQPHLLAHWAGVVDALQANLRLATFHVASAHGLSMTRLKDATNASATAPTRMR